MVAGHGCKSVSGAADDCGLAGVLLIILDTSLLSPFSLSDPALSSSWDWCW